MFRIATLVVLTLFTTLTPHRSSGFPRPAERSTIDFKQSTLMLDVLRAFATGRPAPAAIDRVLAAEGTSLIIEQQNIARHVSMDQYRQLLLALGDDAPPEIAPLGPDARSVRGVKGLMGDVRPALRWAVGHVDLIAERLAALRQMELEPAARRLAVRYLPAGADPTSRLYVVIGGRAGAAALEGRKIYFDIAATSFHAAMRGGKYPEPEETIEFFAHEMHHVGLSAAIDARRKSLKLDRGREQAFNTLAALVLEGSATYLISAHGDLEAMRRDPQYAATLEKAPELLKLVEQIVGSALAGNLSDEAYDKAMEPFLGSGWHCAGAVMLDAIRRDTGLSSVVSMLADPRRVLAAYNNAVPTSPTAWRFNSSLAATIAHIGE